MESTPDSDPGAELINKLNEVVRGYTSIQQQIKEQFALLCVSKPIERLLRRLPDNSSQVHQVLEHVGNLYRRVEDEIRNYLNSAKDFAEENILAVEGVKQQKYEPEEALANFEESLKNLTESFRRVLERHGSVFQDFKHNLGETDLMAGLVNSIKYQSPSNPSQVANPFQFSQQASSTAVSMAQTHATKVAARFAVGVVSFLYGAMSFVLSKPGNSEEEIRILKDDFATVEESLQKTDRALNEHMRTLEDTLTKSTGIAAQVAEMETHSGLQKAVDDIYGVSEKLVTVVNQICGPKV